MTTRNTSQRTDLRTSEPTLSTGWVGVYVANDLDPAYESSQQRRRPTADEILDEHLTSREQLLLEVGLDPSERDRAEVVAR